MRSLGNAGTNNPKQVQAQLTSEKTNDKHAQQKAMAKTQERVGSHVVW
jgi:hypothetical protein